MLGIVDGYIVTLPVLQALASKYLFKYINLITINIILVLSLKENTQFSDVPVIFGTMAQEVDFFPADVILNYTETEYISFITSKYVYILIYSTHF